jgi:hypothetical protein
VQLSSAKDQVEGHPEPGHQHDGHEPRHGAAGRAFLSEHAHDEEHGQQETRQREKMVQQQPCGKYGAIPLV